MSFVHFQKKKVKKERKEESVLLCQRKGEPRPWELRGTVYFESFHCTMDFQQVHLRHGRGILERV